MCTGPKSAPGNPTRRLADFQHCSATCRQREEAVNDLRCMSNCEQVHEQVEVWRCVRVGGCGSECEWVWVDVGGCECECIGVVGSVGVGGCGWVLAGTS